jgi:pimeloyl-ACP methyl ester carboxylesterase
MEGLARMLSSDFRVSSMNFHGHGGHDAAGLPFSIAGFTRQLDQFIGQLENGPVHIFGYSMGGFVALHHSALHPGKVNSVFTLATKFDWNPESARREAAMLEPEILVSKAPGFVKQLEERHAPMSWRNLLRDTASLMIELGDDPSYCNLVKQVQVRCILAVGDRDRMAGVEATLAMYRQLKNASLMVLPDTPHPLEAVAPEILVQEIRRFMLS